ncbi:MAG TPA: serine protease [Kofleriaceae bacterium]|nr:serine protease [Kofleriaceae bacterium]
MPRAAQRFAILALAGWLLALLQLDAPAGVVGRNRFHPVHQAPARPAQRPFRARLETRTRTNLRAIGVYHGAQASPGTGGWGTAFLVAREPDGTGLILTNEHVLRGLGPGAVTFEHETGRPTRAQVTRVVARSRSLDYALLRVELPPGADIPALHLAARRAPDRVYSAGFDHLRALLTNPRLATFDWTDDERAELEALPDSPVQSIQTGRVLFGGETRAAGAMRDPGGRAVRARRTGAAQRALTSLGGIGGGSGRPLLDTADHRVVAIHSSAGILSRRSSEIDLSTRNGAASAGAAQVVLVRHIVADLARRLDQRVVSPRDRASVARLLAGAADADATPPAPSRARRPARRAAAAAAAAR